MRFRRVPFPPPDRSQIMSSRRVWVFVAALVVAFAIAGAAWSWTAAGHSAGTPYAGWSWDGIQTSAVPT
jgi:hypothetical protein